MTKDRKNTSRTALAAKSGRAAITSGKRPVPPVSVVRTDKLADAPLAPEEFRKRLQRLQDLQRKAGEAILTFAVEYTALYKDVARQGTRVDALHEALSLNYRAATRLRSIAAAASSLTPIRDRIPLALDPLYEVTLAQKEDPALVQTAVNGGQITPNSTLREIRAFRRLTQASARQELDVLRRVGNPDAAQQRRRRELESLNRRARVARGEQPKQKYTVPDFLDWLGTLVRPDAVMHSFVQPAVTIDAQFYGTTVIVERFVMTTVRPYVATEGAEYLPVRENRTDPERVTGMVPLNKIAIPPEILAAIRAAHGIEPDLSS